MQRLSLIGIALLCPIMLSACSSTTKGPPKTCRLGEPFVQPEYNPGTGPIEMTVSNPRSYVPSAALRTAKNRNTSGE